MKNQEILLGVILVAIIVAAAYIVFVQPPAVPPSEGPEELELLKKSAGSLSGDGDYYYSYEESQDGYTVVYTLLQKDSERRLGISNPFANKEVYFLGDDTVLCVDFAGMSVCTSVKNNTDSYFVSYLDSLNSKFLDDSGLEEEKEKLDYFYEMGYLKFKGMNDSTVDGNPCREIEYEIDYTNISLADANKYGIAPASPKHFDFVVCIDEDTGLVYSRELTYVYEGEKWDYSFKLVDAEWNTTRTITPPAELSEGAYEALIEEKGWFGMYQQCKEDYTGEVRDNCISDIGTILKSKKVCDMAGTWRDRCLLTVVALTGDEEICPSMEDMEYRDDCYIELAYYTKDETHCASILNVSKKEICIEAVESALNRTTGNGSAGLANPAAVNCADKGYDYEIRTDNETGGEYGVCMYEGLECEEWALYNEECCLDDYDCTYSDCINQTCISDELMDMEEFLNYMETDENETVSENETNSTESS